jgi:hypothetical protein
MHGHAAVTAGAIFCAIFGVIVVITAMAVVTVVRRLAREKRTNAIIRGEVARAEGQANAAAEGARMTHAHLTRESELAAGAVQELRDATRLAAGLAAQADQATRLAIDAVAQTGQAMDQSGRALYVSSQVDTLVELMTAQAAAPSAGRHAYGRRPDLRVVPDANGGPAA